VNATTRDMLDALADCLPETGVRIDTKGEDDRLWLPMPPGADYGFYIDTPRVRASPFG
jgi:hypothetical protein